MLIGRDGLIGLSPAIWIKRDMYVDTGMLIGLYIIRNTSKKYGIPIRQ